MSSLKDIMNLDEEPLQSRNFSTNQQQEENSRSLPQLPHPDTRYTDSRYSAQPLRLPPIDTLPISTSVAAETPSSPSITGKRSRRSSKTPVVSALSLASGLSPAAVGPSPNPANPSSSARRRSSVGTEYMYSRYSQERSISPSAGYSSSNSMGRGDFRRGIEQTGINPRLTPVTGRISKAKKGQPVHYCDVCGNSRKPFSRAEHLRRHMQTHAPPSFICKVLGCEKAFYRKDLLERHIDRHNEPQPSQQMSDNGRRSRSVSPGYMKPEPPQTPPQQRLNMDSMGDGAPTSGYTINGTPAALQAPIDGNMRMMVQYSPASPDTYRGRNSSASNSPSFLQAQQFQPSQQQLASPISLSMDVAPHYGQVSPIVTCVGTSPMVTYATSSSLPAYNMMNPSYPTSNGFHHPYTSVPMSCPKPMPTFPPQMHAKEVAERLLNVHIPQSTPAMNNPHSPMYHSDNSSNSTWSTPSDMSKSHIWPPNTPRDRAFSAPGSYPPPPIMDLNAQYYQHQQMTRSSQPQQPGGMDLAFEGQDFAVCDEDRYTAEMQLQQEQFEAQGGGPVQQEFMEDYYEQQNEQLSY